MSGLSRFGEHFIIKEKRRKRFPHMPFHIVGKHTEEEMGPHVILGTMPYGAHQQFDSFKGLKDPLYLGQTLIASYSVFGGESFYRFTGTDHIDPVQGFFTDN